VGRSSIHLGEAAAGRRASSGCGVLVVDAVVVDLEIICFLLGDLQETRG